MSPPSPHHRQRRSSILVGAGDLERLIAECDDALRADPTCLHTRAVRGHACMKAKRWAQAVRDFSEILDTRPDDVHACFSRGMALFKSARVDEAHRDFTRALELNPAHVMARYARAGCYNSEGEYNQAIQEYWLALRHDEESARAPLRVDGHHRIGWSSGGIFNATTSTSEAALTAAAGSNSDRCDAQVTPSAVDSRATTMAWTCSSVSPSGDADASQASTRPEARRAARKVVQVRVNLSQFALSANQPSNLSVSTSVSGKVDETSADFEEDGARATTKPADDRFQTDSHRPPDAFNSSAHPVATAQPPVEVDRAATPPVRAAPRLVRRVTVVL